MGWLVGYTLGSMAAAFVVVRIFDYIVGGLTSTATDAARGGLFISTWAAVTGQSGMRSMSKTVGRLHKGTGFAQKALDAFSKDERSKGGLK